jgi:mannose/cellobiose epimerase-like protein (N-acyl-D-glucosamine 2-epimerase family)
MDVRIAGEAAGLSPMLITEYPDHIWLTFNRHESTFLSPGHWQPCRSILFQASE